MVISEFHFFQIKGEFFYGDTVMLNQSFFSITPETLQTINVNLPGGEHLFMVNPEMTIATEHKCIIASEFICIDYASSTYLLDCQAQKGICTYIRHNLYLNYSFPLQDAKNGDFVSSATPPLALSPASKVRLIYLHFSTYQTIISAFSYYTPSDQVNCLKYRRIAYINLLSNLPGRQFQLKQFNYPEPVDCAYLQSTQPSPGPFGKGITTPPASKTAIGKSIESVAPALYAETMVLFPQQSRQKSFGCIFRLDNKLKRLYVHYTNINWCQMFYNYLVLINIISIQANGKIIPQLIFGGFR